MLIFVLISLSFTAFSNCQFDDENSIQLEQQHHLFQGDIKLDAKARNGVASENRKWPNGIIPYEIRSGYTREEKDLILKAMKSLERSTCIKFNKRTNEKTYVYIHDSRDGCYTAGVGYHYGAIEMSLQAGAYPNCMHHGTVVHELLHVIGLWHEHMRYDRDKYVLIHYDNIQPGLGSQFEMVDEESSSLYNVPYDYTSVMHYRKTAFSKDGRSVTIEPLQAEYIERIGKSKEASENDILKVNRMYWCNGDEDPVATVEQTTTTPEATTQKCMDLSPGCNSYQKLCKKWTLLGTFCKKTCKFC